MDGCPHLIPDAGREAQGQPCESEFGEGPQRGGVPGAGGRRAGASMEGAAAGQGPAGLETPEGVAAGAAPEEWRDWAGGLPAGLLGKVAGKAVAQTSRGL